MARRKSYKAQAPDPRALFLLGMGRTGANVGGSSDEGSGPALDFTNQGSDPNAPNYLASMAPFQFAPTAGAFTRPVDFHYIRFLIPGEKTIAEQATYALWREFKLARDGVVILMNKPGPWTGQAGPFALGAAYFSNFLSGKSKGYLFRHDLFQVHAEDISRFNRQGADWTWANFNPMIVNFRIGPELYRDGLVGTELWTPGA